jgi:hypothetical protein
MKLITARLCLDCEEVHSRSVCPKCASDAFSYISKWLNPDQEHIENVIMARQIAIKKGAHVGSNR